MLDINEIQKILPHRYPFLLVDRILEVQPGKKVVGLKNVTANEQFFNGHFPGHPIMPGVLIIEAMAQVAGVGLLTTVDNPEEKVPYFARIEDARFKHPVKPGDQLIFEVEVVKLRRGIGKVAAKALVDGEIVTEATLTCAIQDK
ncbi:3-hydroxyacyl-[acyl-carrier-protein] dehydratase [Orenia metallireducens]|uniref:3-hydroxyacyl-[acyl-carrier-protein] dehydratase FabZ n=1 Tax=Orenia metallireducens TaxID=1413210 RepID=A0A285GLL7_9FIRM|nr:3-hydroxyacyl-ACP dehydratase FabZ [Orenia metallireducens]PRX35727.1 3-hydroxyacyl-[acyl-carrier-protein] dehydratase [Orenia metallireducens]SNY24328.1 3-hydroxyacyl-[acyl-carrier-protein] dehydratase [Orenia metallireducens]